MVATMLHVTTVFEKPWIPGEINSLQERRDVYNGMKKNRTDRAIWLHRDNKRMTNDLRE